MPQDRITRQVARELSLSVRQVSGALALFGEGATLPFIARYRKEATGGLNDLQLRDVRDRATYLTELEERRATILASIEEQRQLTPELKARVVAADTKQALEDLYLPYKPKRRTRATIAAEKGLEPLADALWSGALDDARARESASSYVSEEKGVESADDALAGARDILAERVAEDAELRGWVRQRTRAQGVVVSSAARGKADDPDAAKFRDYFEHGEPVGSIPSHRMLAIRRGEAEGALVWTIDAPVEEIAAHVERAVVADRAARQQMARVAKDAYKRLLAPSIEAELGMELRERAEEEAIAVFGQNLENLLLQPPAGERATLGLDPGFRTGVKAAVVSKTGAVLETSTLYLHQGERFRAELDRLVDAHAPELVAIGNGTASRETEAAVRGALRERPGKGPQVVLVNESGASVYSASDVAREELPDMDVSLRGAVSIARRLQDPLAELVKIDPKSIGVGQYQHDVNQPRLKTRLDETVELAVNRVGVELNTASAPLLSYVAGIGPTLARNVIEVRDRKGGLKSRKELLEVPRLGPKAFEQAAGFLRIRGASQPLDATAVHPERYALVEKMAADLGVELGGLIQNDAALETLEGRLERYASGDVGLPTLRDILDELRRPGRDPREAFEAPTFREDVQAPKDLKPGMALEGVVTNVVAFGAFVDVGVHQDGLVHVSQLADRFVKDPNEVVKVGQKVRVTVLDVDLQRNRIGLSMKQGRRP
ncbi:MAG TPA: Tex family protein [Longimicrobiales bacterium]|nr:Tex family protein [Longimicrobiales bacterium]